LTESEHTARLAAIPEGERNVFLDLLLEHWPRLATVAWDGWLAQGRGAVTIENGSVPPALAYRAGAPCPCHAGAVEAYDPETQVVVAVVDDDGSVAWLETLGGVPTPAESETLAPAADVTVH